MREGVDWLGEGVRIGLLRLVYPHRCLYKILVEIKVLRESGGEGVLGCFLEWMILLLFNGWVGPSHRHEGLLRLILLQVLQDLLGVYLGLVVSVVFGRFLLNLLEINYCLF